MMERRWMWYETLFLSVKERLAEFLKDHGIKYEVSGMSPGYHFEIYVNDYEAQDIDYVLAEDAIVEVR